jgi:hypothetical protein
VRGETGSGGGIRSSGASMHHDGCYHLQIGRIFLVVPGPILFAFVLHS